MGLEGSRVRAASSSVRAVTAMIAGFIAIYRELLLVWPVMTSDLR